MVVLPHLILALQVLKQVNIAHFFAMLYPTPEPRKEKSQVAEKLH